MFKLQRKESRGLHYTLDYPDADPALEHVDTVLDPKTEVSTPKYSYATSL